MEVRVKQMNTEKTDRRVRRTRALLLQGLIQLMKEKDIKDISVKELSDLVDINRGTFYLHYNDIYDMVNKIEEELFIEFNQILNKDLTSSNQLTPPKETLLDIFSLLERHRELAQVMIGPHGDLAFVNHLKTLVKDRLQYVLDSSHSSQDYEYYYAFIVSGCIGIFDIWLNHPNPRTPEEMADICSTILLKGPMG